MFKHLLPPGQAKFALFDAQRVIAPGEAFAQRHQFIMADRVKADLVEKAQQPGLGKGLGFAIPIPHLHRTSDELIAARAFHPINTQISTADAHGVFRRPGTRRIVFRGDQSVAGINRRGDGRAEIHIP